MESCELCSKKEATIAVYDGFGNTHQICVWCDWIVSDKETRFDQAKLSL